MLKEKE